MSDRYTRKDAEALVRRLTEHMLGDDELNAAAGHIYLSYESGVYRLRFIHADTSESDLSPGMTTAREAWLYIKGVLDGRGLVSTVQFMADEEARVSR